MEKENKQKTYREKIEKGLIATALEMRQAENRDTGEKMEVEVMAIYTKRFDPEDGTQLEDDVQIILYDDLVSRIDLLGVQLETLQEVKKDFETLQANKKD